MVGPFPTGWSVDPDDVAVFQLRAGLWSLRLPLPWPGLSRVNAYAIEADPDGVVLVDCGIAGDESCWEALHEGLRQTGHTPADVRRLVITHAHSDHFGLAARVVEESGCTLEMHPAHEPFTDAANEPVRIETERRRHALLQGVPQESVRFYSDVAEEVDAALPVPRFTALASGMRIPTGLGEWTVVETPGHAPSHLLLHQPELGIAIVGDLISRVFAPWYDHGYTADPVSELHASLDVLAGLDVELALPGHGRPIENVAEIVAMHHTELGSRVAAVAAAVAGGATSAYAVSREVFGRDDEMIDEVSHFVETLVYLDHLRLREEIIRDDNDDAFVYAAVPGV